MTKQRTPAVERLYRARRAAAKELKLPITSWQVRRFALLMVGHDNLTAKLANGADVSIDNLLRLDLAMQEIRSSVPQEPIKVEIEIVEPTPILPPPDPAPPTPPTTETSPAPSAPQPQGNVVPIRKASESNAAPLSETMRAWNRLQGYSIAPDGKLGRGNSSRGAPVVW